jgi:hypothetical protein
VCAVGCKTATLSQAGAKVVTSQTAPVDQGYDPTACKSLGYVDGRGGGSFGGGWISNEKLVKYAMNDLQNQVATLGGNYVQHDTPQMGVSGDKNGTTTSTATVSGTAFYCDPTSRKSTRTAAAPAPATAPAAAPATAPAPAAAPSFKDPPQGAGGFLFGEKVADAQKRCTGARLKWSLNGDDADCSGTLVAIGSSARTRLHVCGGVVCGVDVLVSESGDRIVPKYDELYDKLENKYGIPQQRRAPVDQACAANLQACLEGPAAPAPAAWRWPDGNVVEAKLAVVSGKATVSLAYSNPARTKSTAPGPAL